MWQRGTIIFFICMCMVVALPVCLDGYVACGSRCVSLAELCTLHQGVCEADGTVFDCELSVRKMVGDADVFATGDDDDDDSRDFIDWLKILSIPILAAFIGWATNVVAIKMTFYPVDYMGIPGTEDIRILDMPIFGWQGIIPSKAEFMASLSVDLMTSKLIDVEEVFSRLDPVRVAQELEPNFNRMFSTIVEDVALERAPTSWQALPSAVKDEIVEYAKQDAPECIRAMMQEVKTNIAHVFDLKSMVVSALLRDKALLNEMFLKCGKDEFRFIEISGLYIGFAFGLFQMVIWLFYQGWWLLPLCGFIGGYLTNFVALKIIFLPVEPRKVCGFKMHGLFLRRQEEVARMYAAMVASNILNANNIIHAIICGPASDSLFEIVHKHVDRAIDDFSGITRPLVAFTLGGQEYKKVKEQVADKIIKQLPETMKYAIPYTEEALDIENTLREKLADLSFLEFERLLHPVFEQDELKLIIVGAILGMAVGFFQAFVING